jgi:hypothetical protein
MYKTKIFGGSRSCVEDDMNNFFYKNPDIEILQFSHRTGDTISYATVCIVYKERKDIIGTFIPSTTGGHSTTEIRYL